MEASDLVPDEVSLLQSLKFTPISPARYTPTKKAAVKQHERITTRHARQLQKTLQNLVQAHQTALFEGTGSIDEVRNDLYAAVCSLRDVLDDDVHLNRHEVVKLHGQREDVDSLETRMEELSSDSTKNDQYKTEEVELQRVENEISQVKLQMKALEKRKSDLKRSMQDIQLNRMQKNQETEQELTRLRGLPSAEEITESIKELNKVIDKEEQEVDALSEGSELLAEVIEFLSKTETRLAEAIQVGLRTSRSSSPTSSSHATTSSDEMMAILDQSAHQLDQWLELVTEKKWKLLQVVIASEREAVESARSMIH